MSNLMLCHEMSADRPYNVVGLGINIYSAEELCYLIAQNAHTLDHDFMDERLCEFLDKQLKMADLASKLRELLHTKGTLSDFVMTILNGIDYCDEDEIRNIRQILVESAGLSPARKHKSRGDNLLKARKFARAIDEYIGTLEKIDMDAEPILYAAVLHNMGTTYAKLLLFEKAAEYYMEAYKLNMDDESLILHIVCCNLYMTGEQYDRMIIRCGYSERVLKAADDILRTRNDYNKTDNRYAKQLESLKELKENGRIGQYYDAVDATLDSWKREYRLNMILR
ncbi:MAG: hypothetical protein IJT80_08440 [Lachnospiraceae bacterium]|nr:hypothetical protein [Lachnospiraceae bacterium]